ncbi:chromate transporter [Jeotgalibaca ciconiae]|uniref:Chromate transporter n=1 Tax=Jeotgalibaca ciconiae TaxID=2496265 RepID=A0A3S9H7J8_9LACT|nr:chromate transporter [Jeotgalibaca ciconiae]AZP03317.1 chromate transporter [Jeotgalibaca ciconiae]HJB23389.1 chromate transporter [Candidatus Jeotgalibaca pullicola]
MIYWELFYAFFKIGLFTIGGGYASLPLIEDEVVNNYSWLTLQEYLDIVTISQITPGPIAINSATFVGTKTAGFLGSIVATMGTIAPSVIIALILAKIYYKYRSVDSMQGVLTGLRPAVVALITSAGASLLVTALFQTGGIQIKGFSINLMAILMMIIAFIGLRKYKIGSILIIFLCGIFSVLLSFVGLM